MHYIVENDDEIIGIRLDKALALIDEDMTRGYIQKLIENGYVKVNAKVVKASYKLKEKDIIDTTNMEMENADILPENIQLDIVFEDEDIIIINKEKGMVVHPGNGNYTGTIVNSLMYTHKNKLSGINGLVRPGIVHRIDKDTTGIIVVAKNDNAHQKLSQAFKVHDITRKYIALVEGIVERDNLKIDLPIGRSQTDRIKMAVTKRNSKKAITNIKVLERFNKSNCTLVEATLETGRTHQIRVHMAYIGHPLIGDEVYGNSKNEFGVKGQMLHAKTLGFVHPTTGKYVEFNQELPKEFKEIISKLEKTNREQTV